MTTLFLSWLIFLAILFGLLALGEWRYRVRVRRDACGCHPSRPPVPITDARARRLP